MNNILQFIDLTTLSIDDTTAKVQQLCRKGISKHVAAICVYPNFVSSAKNELQGSGLKVASVAGGFPAAQIPIDIKVAEVRYAVNNGADEIDMVLSVGKLIEGKEAEAAEEIRAIKEACGNATLKCILETGALKTPELIKLASEIAINNGANFIKTSTGKISPAATIDASRIMLEVIKGHFVNTGERIGFKAAGGISTYEDACAYINLVKNVIGEEWLKPELFRIGASRLVDNL